MTDREAVQHTKAWIKAEKAIIKMTDKAFEKLKAKHKYPLQGDKDLGGGCKSCLTYNGSHVWLNVNANGNYFSKLIWDANTIERAEEYCKEYITSKPKAELI